MIIVPVTNLRTFEKKSVINYTINMDNYLECFLINFVYCPFEVTVRLRKISNLARDIPVASNNIQSVT